jgi:hypothetical protein
MYQELCNKESDINEHLPTLRDLASECHHITEMGVRGVVSSWAFAEGLKSGSNLIMIDKAHPAAFGGSLDEIQKRCAQKGIAMQFKLADTTKIGIDKTDLLFIDTQHTYEQLRKELELHPSNVEKYLVFHDTTTFGEVGDDSKSPGLWTAIEEFLVMHPEWKIKFRHTNCNGLTCLEKC